MKARLHNRTAVLIFTLPALVLFTVVVFLPILQTFRLSFYSWDGLGTRQFIWFDNYRRLMIDPDFTISLINGLIFAGVLVMYQTGMATILSFFLINMKHFGHKFFRKSYFLPVVLSTTVACQLWLSVYNHDFGLLNKFFEMLGLPFRQSWLAEKSTSIWAIALVNAWQYMGIHLILIYTAIKSIPEHYYEAALIDGASSFRAHLKITFPLLAETYKFCLIIAITGGLKAFEQMYIMTNGGPGTLTYTLTFMMYKGVFRNMEYGYACSSAAVLVLQCLLFTILINKLIARERVTY
jgi:ABC-type sugar transport systems, permease components